MLSCISDGFDFAINAPVAKAAGHQYAVYIVKNGIHIVMRDSFGIYPLDINYAVVGNTAVFQCFHHTDICVMELRVFADKGNRHGVSGSPQGFHHCLPVGQIRLRAFQFQAFARHLCQMLFFHGEGRLIQMLHVQIL